VSPPRSGGEAGMGCPPWWISFVKGGASERGVQGGKPRRGKQHVPTPLAASKATSGSVYVTPYAAALRTCPGVARRAKTDRSGLPDTSKSVASGRRFTGDTA